MYSQQQQLPVPANQFINQFTQYEIPAHAFAGSTSISNPAQLQIVINAAVTNIQSNAQKNALRVFMFNLCSQNNWLNADFVEVLEQIAIYANHLMGQGIRTTIDEASNQIIELLTAFNAQKFPALQNYLDQNTGPAVQTLIGQYQQLMNQINGAQRAMPGYGMPQQRQMPSQPNQAVFRNFGSGADVAPQTAFFNRNAPVQSNTNFAGSKWAEQQEVRLAPVEKPVFQQQINTSATNAANLNNPPVNVMNASDEYPAKVGWENWFPTPEIPYIPAVNWKKYELKFKMTAGLYVPVLNERSIMDYDAHAIPTNYGFIPRDYAVVDPDATIIRLMDGIRNIKREKEQLAIGADIDLKTLLVSQTEVVEIDKTSAWYETSLDRLKLPKVPMVYMTGARVTGNPIVDTVSQEQFLMDIRKSKTLIEFRERLTSSLDVIPRPLWTELDRRLTRKINRCLKLNLSIPTLTIDSFTEDVEALIGLLKDKYGVMIHDGFMKHQTEIIRSTINVLDKDLSKSLSENVGGVFGESVVTYLSTKHTLTHINCCAHDLSIDVPKTIGVLLDQEQSPEFYELAKYILTNHADSDNPYESHLIRTEDFRVFELSQGWLGSNFFTLMLVD